MSQKKKTTKRILSISMLSAMLLNTALPQSLAHVYAAENPSQQSTSSGTFTTDEVNRILAGLTPEQKANINKLTGAETTEKIHLDPKDLRGTDNKNVIVQFKVDPAKIQMIKEALADDGSSSEVQSFNADYSAAQKAVTNSHSNFEKFVNSQPKTMVVGGKSIDSSIHITRSYTTAFNGVSLTLPASLVTKIASSPDVTGIWLDNTVKISDSTAQSVTSAPSKATDGLKWLGIDQLQAAGYTGAGIKVGVLDTGIDYNHPDLYRATHDAEGNRYDGHDFINKTVDTQGNVTYIDDHDPMETTYQDWVKYNTDALSNPFITKPPLDYKKFITEHGTHVSGTIAANTTTNNAMYSANGVAPNVELHGYRVLGPGGSGAMSGIIAGIDQSVKDGMQVINLSLGGSSNNPLSPDCITINNASLQGVVPVVAAGNAGPAPATNGSPGIAPFALTVGASTIPEQIPVMTIQFGSKSYQARLFAKSFADKDTALAGNAIRIVDVGMGGAADYESVDVTGKIVLVHRGVDLLTTKLLNAKKSGAAGMIIWNNQSNTDSEGYIPNFMGTSQDNIYSVSLTQAQGQELVNAIAASPNTATVKFPSELDAPITKSGDILANFSSTGPVVDYAIKPDVVAPGVDIMSTAPFDAWDPTNNGDYRYNYMMMSGTSMATPHVAGICALILQAHPNYSPADVKTALMNTAKNISTPSQTYSVYQQGAGRVDPARAINANVKIQVEDTGTTATNVSDTSTFQKVTGLTGSLNYRFVSRGTGAPAGSDDVIQSKKMTITNSGTSDKTFNVSTQFITPKFDNANPVGSGTGNDVHLDVAVSGQNKTSIVVGAGKAVNTAATITVPANAIKGTYEGYLKFVNAADSSESYQVPFAIVVSKKEINFDLIIKAISPDEVTNFYSPNGQNYTAMYTFSANSEMKDVYLLLKDMNNNYLGIVQNVSDVSLASPGSKYGPFFTFYEAKYIPFKSTYSGSIDNVTLSDTAAYAKSGAYQIEMVGRDKAGNQFKKSDTVYVNTQLPSFTMDADAQPGVYEIDPTGFAPGQEIKRFNGTVLDSTIDTMLNNGEDVMPNLEEGGSGPVDQSQNYVWGYQDGIFPTVVFKTDESGRFHFGITPEDIKPQGEKFWIYPTGYSGAGDVATQRQFYYFIKKGSPYVTLKSSGGNPDYPDKVVVGPNQTFTATIDVKNAIGMKGGSFTLDNGVAYTISNVRLSNQYKTFLSDNGVSNPDSLLTVTNPVTDWTDSTYTQITIDSSAPALTSDLPILQADVKYTHPLQIVGPVDYHLISAKFNLNGSASNVPYFDLNSPYIQQPTSLINGGIFAESFLKYSVGGSFVGITTASGARATATEDVAGGKTFVTDDQNNPGTATQNNTVQYGGATNGLYGLTVDASKNAYNMKVSMPGHFSNYFHVDPIYSDRYGYPSGGQLNISDTQTPLMLAGDVNGDNVIDMKDLVAEINAYYGWKEMVASGATLQAKTNFLATNRSADINWIPVGTAGFGIDYYDFYYIFQNFGRVNQSAINAGMTVPSVQNTVDASQAGTISAPTAALNITLSAGENLQTVMTKLNFAGPAIDKTIAAWPTLQQLQNGTNVVLSQTHAKILDDVAWSNAITEIDLTSPSGSATPILLRATDGTSNSKVTISTGQYLGIGNIYPGKITLQGSNFPVVGNYTLTVKATGYKDVTKTIQVANQPLPIPTIPLITDPSLAHIGKDLTFNFADDAVWRNGIYKIVVATLLKSITLTTASPTPAGQYDLATYCDISKSGQITFKKNVFMTSTPLSASSTQGIFNNAPIVPDGVNYLPQIYKFTISSKNESGTDYPDVKIADPMNLSNAAQAVGFGVTFDTSKGGSPVSPIAVGFMPTQSKVDANAISGIPSGKISNQIANGQSGANPKSTKPGYAFQYWSTTDPTLATPIQWSPSNVGYGDLTVYPVWKFITLQQYSPVVAGNVNGPKFDGVSAGATGTVLGEGDLKIEIPDYVTNASWLSDVNNIQNITVGSTTIDRATYSLTYSNGSAFLNLKTATHDYAVAHPTEKFAFSESSPKAGYSLTVTPVAGILGAEAIPVNVKLGYRSHIDLNGGTLINANDKSYVDSLVFSDSLAYGPDMSVVDKHVTNNGLSVNPSLYLDAVGSPNMKSPISLTTGVPLTNNTTFYLSWMKTPPTLYKQVLGNTVGKDIVLRFTDDGLWKNNITKISISTLSGQKILNSSDYTIGTDIITLKKSLFTNAQMFNVTVSSSSYVDDILQGQVIGYSVDFDSNGGDSVDSQIVYSHVTKPDNPTLVGYKFVGWYTNSTLTNLFDFASVVTAPMKLYAKYALAAPIVSPQINNNCLGNAITLTYDDPTWGRYISNISFNGKDLDASKYTVDIAARKITLDKNLFTRLGNYSIVISASNYADIRITQEIVEGSNIHFVLPSDAPASVVTAAANQIVSARATEPLAHGYDLTWYTDADYTNPWSFTTSVYSDKTIYGKWSLHKFNVVFDSQNGSLVESKTADYTTTITSPEAPTRPGYAFLGWYKDTVGKTAWNFAADKVTGDTILYAKWASGVENNGLYNKDVNIIFNEATATLDGKAFTSGSTVSSEGNHTLVVTDAAGNTATIKFTIDKTAPNVTGVSNNGLYNHDVTVTFNEGTATLNGNAITNGTVVSIEGTHTLIVTDKAGNVTTVKFTIDKTAPTAPIVNEVTKKTTEVTGIAEAGSVVVIKVDKKIIGTATADKYGNFTVSIEKQKAGTILFITAKDEAGNVSRVKEVSVINK